MGDSLSTHVDLRALGIGAAALLLACGVSLACLHLIPHLPWPLFLVATWVSAVSLAFGPALAGAVSAAFTRHNPVATLLAISLFAAAAYPVTVYLEYSAVPAARAQIENFDSLLPSLALFAAIQTAFISGLFAAVARFGGRREPNKVPN